MRTGGLVACLAVVIAIALPCIAQPTTASAPARSQPASVPAEKLAKLIRELGGKDAGLSEAAKKELAALGPAALDALTVAQDDSDRDLADRAAAVRDDILKKCYPAPFYEGVGMNGKRVVGQLPDGRFVDENDNIFENGDAMRLYESAKMSDPMFAPRDKVDRDKCVKLYIAAMEAQPWAAMNAPIAERIAQLYSQYSDPRLGYKPDFKVAALWWQKCIDSTASNQLIWAQAYMGAGCTGVIDRRKLDATGCFLQILKADPSKIEPPRWKFRSSSAQYYADVDQAKKRLEEVQVLAVTKIDYSLRTDKKRAIELLRKISQDRKDTPVGDKADELLAKLEKK